MGALNMESNRLSLKFGGICAIILLLSGCISASGQHTSAAETSIRSIEQLIRAHHYDLALKVTRSELNKYPRDYRLWTLRGIVFSIQGDDLNALTALDKALRLNPDYNAALKAEVELYYKGKDKKAIPLLNQILLADPADETAHEMLGVLEGRQGDCALAAEQFTLSGAALAKHPESLEIYGGCLEQIRQPEKAVPAFQQLSALVPDRTYPRYDLAVVLVESKRSEEALKILAPLLAEDPNDPDLLSVASDAYEATGDTPRAVSLLRQAIVLNPTNAAYYTSFAVLCLDHESFQVGVDMIDAGLKRIPDDPSLYISRGLLYAQIAKYDDAELDFKTAENLDSKQSLSAYALDLAELQKNSSASALTNVRAQLKVHPESANLHFLLAKLLSGQGLGSGAVTGTAISGQAMEAALAAVRLKPDMTEARDLLATLYAESGQYELAIEQCRLALRSNPDDQTAIYHLIVDLRHGGKGSERDEIPGLVKQLAELQKTSRQQETDRKRFKLVEQAPPSHP
jgi:tetratricopeptide (TPR) repeat protein